MATELILIRHGNAVRVNGDYVHAPLTELGQEQAAKTGQHFNDPENNLDGLYSSPLRRTQETAQIIGEKIGQKVEFNPGVQELRFIEVFALVVSEILSITRYLDQYLYTHAGIPIRWPIVGRVSTVLLDVISRHPNERVAVVAHSGVISAVLSWYFPKNRWRWWRTTVSNCSLTRFRVEGNRASLLAVNDIQHLSPAMITTQPPAKTVEIAQAAHKVEEGLKIDQGS